MSRWCRRAADSCFDCFSGTFPSGRRFGRPAILPVPAALLRLLLGRMADEILLSGPRVLPAKAMASGFAFRYPTLEAALAEILHSSAPTPMGASSTALRLCEDGERRPS